MDPMRPEAEAVDVVQVVAVPEPQPDTSKEDRALIAEFRRRAQVPSWLQAGLERMESNRRYLHTDALHEDDPYAIAINFLYRKGQQKLANIWPRDAEPACKPAATVQPTDGSGDPAAAEQRQRVADTAAVVLRHLAREGDLLGALRGAAEDAIPSGIAWIKVGWQEDSQRDFLGRKRGQDQQDQIALLRSLGQQYAAGAFSADDARFQQMQDLDRYVRQALLGAQVAGRVLEPWMGQALAHPGIMPWWVIPEPKTWRGATYDLIRAEDLRLDWSRVRTPRQHRDGRWVLERVWMSRQEVATRWELTTEEQRRLGSRTHASDRAPEQTQVSEAGEPGAEGLDDATRSGDEIAVWEVWDWEVETRYVYAEGLDRFLERHPITLRSRLRSPYIPIVFNPVAGRFMPLSDVDLGRKLQEEIIQSLTDASEGRQARLPKYVADGTKLDEETARQLENCRPHQVVRTKMPVEDVRKAFQVLEGAAIDRSAYDMSDILSGLNEMVAVPSEATGRISKPQFAEQVKVMSAAMGTSADYMAEVITEAMRDALTITLDYLSILGDQAWVQHIAGPHALWPLFETEEVLRGLTVEVIAAGSQIARQQELEGLGMVTEALSKLVQLKQAAALAGLDVDIDALAAKALKAADLRMPVGRFLRPLAPQGMPMGPGVPGMPPGILRPPITAGPSVGGP